MRQRANIVLLWGFCLILTLSTAGCQVYTPAASIVGGLSDKVKAYEIHLNEMKDKIYKANGIAPDNIKVRITNLPSRDNAWAQYMLNRILITTGLLGRHDYDDHQIAYILAHEIAHFKRNHITSRLRGMSTKERELEADEYGAKWAAKAGYNACKMYKYWIRLSIGKQYVGDYPSNSSRAAVLRPYANNCTWN